MSWPPAPPPRGSARWPIVVMFVITLIAIGAAVAAWLRPTPEPQSAAPPALIFSDQQVADAKSKVCTAYEKVRRALAVNATRNGGDDPTAQLAVAVNARQVYVASSAHLLTILVDEPAIRPELATAARKLAGLFQVLTLDGLAADPNEQGHDAADQTLSTIQKPVQMNRTATLEP